MHTWIRASAMTALALAVIGCRSGTSDKPGVLIANVASPTAPTTAPTVSANSTSVVMHAGGVPVLKLTTAPNIKSTAEDGLLSLTSPQLYEVHVWLVTGAKSIDEAAGRLDAQIAPEFKDFKPDQKMDLTIAGSPAQQMSGKGHEADDGDPGAADVIIFKADDRIFIACYHGESIDTAGEQWMLSVLQTAQGK